MPGGPWILSWPHHQVSPSPLEFESVQSIWQYSVAMLGTGCWLRCPMHWEGVSGCRKGHPVVSSLWASLRTRGHFPPVGCGSEPAVALARSLGSPSYPCSPDHAAGASFGLWRCQGGVHVRE